MRRINLGNDRSDAKYCPICGNALGGNHQCPDATLRAIDAAAKREDAPAFVTFPSETKRLIEGLGIMDWGDDEPIYYDNPLHQHGIYPPEEIEEQRKRERY